MKNNTTIEGTTPIQSITQAVPPKQKQQPNFHECRLNSNHTTKNSKIINDVTKPKLKGSGMKHQHQKLKWGKVSRASHKQEYCTTNNNQNIISVTQTTTHTN